MTEEKARNLEPVLQSLINYYNETMEDLYEETRPGQIRSKKGELVEELTRRIVKATWVDYLEQSERRLEQSKKKKAIKMLDADSYIQRYENEQTLQMITTKKPSIKYNFGTDDHIRIDKKFVLAIECKAYTESAMLKRIIYDRKMLHEFAPDASYVLLQLESALGGDFELCSKSVFGSNQYHVFMSREETNIEVITLLEGRRKAEYPIHKRENRKELKKEHLLYAIESLGRVLEKHI